MQQAIPRFPQGQFRLTKCRADGQLYLGQAEALLRDTTSDDHPVFRMKASPLSRATCERVNSLFAPAERVAATTLLVERCGNNLPFLDKLNSLELERFRFAALKLSDGTLAGLEKAVQLANLDWRDLLMAAGFADDVTEHERWQPIGHEGF